MGLEGLYLRLDTPLGCALQSVNRERTSWGNLKSCCREEKQEYPEPLHLGLPQGRGGSQRGPDWGPSVCSFLFASQTSWAGIARQEKFLSLAGVWGEAILGWFCEQPVDSRGSG